MAKPESKKVLTAHKSLGQHFLTDHNIIQKIIGACRISKSDTVLEIGPGLGALTFALCAQANQVIAVEKDKRLCGKLKESPLSNLEIMNQDILKFEFEALREKVKAVGNLPYNISSPIIEKLISNRDKLTSIFLTVQLEFGQRIIAEPGSEDYSALSCFVQYYTVPKILFKIKGTCFRPIPKVDSCFMQIELRTSLPAKAKNEELLFKIIHAAFGQRRKMILNSLSSLIEKEKLQTLLASLKINPQLRAENLGLSDFVRIADAVH